MKKLFLAAVVISLNFVSCTSDDLDTTEQTTSAKEETVDPNSTTIVENEPIKDKTRD